MSAEHRPWTLPDLEHLAEDCYRYEIIDGQLVVSPPPAAGHQRLADLLCRRLGELAVTATGLDVPVHLGRQESYVIPDVLVAKKAFGFDKEHFVAEEVSLVAEVVSPGSQRRDRHTKLDLYSELGVPTYLLVESQDRQVRHFVLLAGRYVELEDGLTWDWLVGEQPG